MVVVSGVLVQGPCRGPRTESEESFFFFFFRLGEY